MSQARANEVGATVFGAVPGYGMWTKTFGHQITRLCRSDVTDSPMRGLRNASSRSLSVTD
jgi:hypothetical protein